MAETENAAIFTRLGRVKAPAMPHWFREVQHAFHRRGCQGGRPGAEGREFYDPPHVLCARVDHEGMPWIRAAELARALGYKREDKIGRLYQHNADEFTPSMTQAIEILAEPHFGTQGNMMSHSALPTSRPRQTA